MALATFFFYIKNQYAWNDNAVHLCYNILCIAINQPQAMISTKKEEKENQSEFLDFYAHLILPL